MSKLQPMKSTIPMQSANGTHARGFCFSDSLEEKAGFVWDGSHLLQEIQPDGRYIYIYINLDSYDSLAPVRDWTTEDGEGVQQAHYFHCDQIGIPREMTDKGYHRGYNQAIMEIVDNIDKNSKCDREKARKIQSLQSKIHKALKLGSMSLYKPTTKQDWINYLT